MINENKLEGDWIITPPSGDGIEGDWIIETSNEENKDISKNIGSTILDNWKSAENTVIKGIIEGVSRFGKSFGPLKGRESSEEELKKQTERLDELLPSDEKEFTQRALRRGLREAPTVLSFPGSSINTLPRAILAGFMGEGAKDLGLPEIAQSAAEITAYIGPDLTKKLISSGKNKEIIEAGRYFNLSDEQIAPLLQNDFKQKWLSKLSPKRGRTQKILGKTKEGLEEGYQSLRSNPKSKVELPREIQESLLKELGEVGLDIPSIQREKITKDMQDLLRKPITTDTLINLYQDINASLGDKSNQLSRLKDPIKKAIEKFSPELSEDFNKLNMLYGKYKNIAGKLKPTLVSDLISSAQSLGLIYSFITESALPFEAILTKKGAEIGARELLLNPRLQQLSEKFLTSLNSGKYAVAYSTYKEFNKELKKQDENLNQVEITIQDMKDIFSNSNQ